MKPSHFRTPRTLGEGTFTPGYDSEQPDAWAWIEDLGHKALGFVVCVGIVGLAAALWLGGVVMGKWTVDRLLEMADLEVGPECGDPEYQAVRKLAGEAPKLLEALQKIADAARGGVKLNGIDIGETARAAIAKATGATHG